MENKDNIWPDPTSDYEFRNKIADLFEPGWVCPDPISHQQVNTVLFDRIKQKFEMLETANMIKDIIIATEFAIISIILLLIVF